MSGRSAPLRRLALLTVVLLWASAQSARASDGVTRALIEPAARIWASMPSGSRIAVAPIDPDTSGLPDALLIEVERSFAAALLATAPTGSAVSSRRDLPMAWEEAESFTQGAAAGLLAQAAVDAVAVASVAEQADGVTLSAVLLAVRGEAVGDVLATMAPTALALEMRALGLAGAEAGARRLGVALAEGLRASVDPSAAFTVRVHSAGDRGAAGQWFAALVAEHVSRRLAQAPPYMPHPLRSLGSVPAPRTVVLELALWDHGDRLDIHGRASMGEVAARSSVRIAVRSIPRSFLPLTRDGGRVGLGLQQAVGSFEPQAPTDRREVLFAARVLARAALIDRTLGSGGGDRRGRGHADLTAAMGRLAKGIPHEEVWHDESASAPAAAQTLRARMSPIGGGEAPILEASIERAVYRAGERMGVRVLVRGGRAHVAVFVWQADDTVVRIAPWQEAALRVEAAQRTDLPGPGDPEIAPAPLPGSQETVEAVIVVASALPFSADALAPLAGETASDSLAGAVEMSAFLDMLVGLDLTRTSLAVLPYRVRAKD